MQLSGQNETCPALLTVPSNFLEDGTAKSVGIVLGHGTYAEAQRGQFLTNIAVHFAKHGYVVMRYYCRQKELRRQRIFERSADTAAHSPYARGVKKWVYVGHENGARIAALVGYKSPRPKHGFIFLSYPLLEPAPPPPKQKAGAEPPADSIGPLLKLAETIKAPVLFISGELDYNCPGRDLKSLGPAFKNAGLDARAAILPDMDAEFCGPNAKVVAPETQAKIVHLIETFLKAIADDSFAETTADLPVFESIVPSDRVPPRPNAALAEEEDEDDGGDNNVPGAPSIIMPAPLQN